MIKAEKTMEKRRAIFTEVSDDGGLSWHRMPDRWEQELPAPPSVTRAFAAPIAREHRRLLQEHAHTPLLMRLWLSLCFCVGVLGTLTAPLWLPFLALRHWGILP